MTPAGDPAPSAVPAAGASPGLAARVLSEATVVARAQDGDTAAFEQLMQTYQAELFRLAYRMLHDRGEAQDVVQDTFVLVWRKLPTLADPQAFHGWIYQIATRSCLQVSRTRARRRTDLTSGTDADFEARSQTLDAERGTGPPEVAQATAQRESLDVVLADLPGDQRACWVLKELHDLTYPEIAFVTGVPVSTVRGRIARARQTLTVRMAPWR